MKLWDKGTSLDKLIEEFTTGNDRVLDLQLAKYDVVGSKAHANMLCSINMLTDEENKQIQRGLNDIQASIEKGNFIIDEGVEDVHSQVELLLTKNVGPVGKKLHLARSRNDQVLVDLRLFFRDQLELISTNAASLVKTLLNRAEETKSVLMPGYTHMQVGMVSSYGMWFSAFAEAILDDAELALSIKKVLNKNPLGTAAGYGSSMPIDREQTTKALGFDQVCINPINSQLNRGKSELLVAQAISSFAVSINKMAMDLCLQSNENYRFFYLPTEFTTGSSIMPHKKNPDVFELIRAKTNILLTVPNQVTQVISNLTTGYHRDFQLIKEVLFPAIHSILVIFEVLSHCLPQIGINKDLIQDQKYDYLFSVEKVNEYVLAGMPFRDAYKKVGMEIEAGEYIPTKEVEHTHLGSVGNLGLDQLSARLDSLSKQL